MASVSEDSLQKSMQHTELFKVNDKHKYINTNFKKVSAKIYDYKCDVKLKVEKENFKAHRDVLAEASDYFSAMFSHNMKEKEQTVIELHEIGPKGFTAMMDYFYHGHITVDPDNIEDVIEAARFFHIEWLVHICCDFLIRFLSLENYHIVLHLVDKYYLGDLRPGIFSFVSHNFITLAEQAQFVDLSYDLLYLLLSEDHYIDATESFIFNVVLKWLRHDADRAQHKSTLLELIRYPLLEVEALESIPEDVTEVHSVKGLVDEALMYNANPTRQCLMNSDQACVRGASDVVAMYSAIYDAHEVNYKVPSMEGFFTEEIDTGFMQNLFEFSAVASLGNFLFMAGGYGRRSWCSSPAFYSYNPRNRLWAQLSSMHMPRVSFSLCPAEKGLYAVAGIEHIVDEGRDQEIILNSVEFYDPDENLWSLVANLPFGCFNCASTVIDDRLYVAGGITDDPEDNVPVNYVHVYNPREKTCDIKARMNVERHCHAMVAAEKRLFVFGGYTTGLDTMSFEICRQNEVYDLETNQWTLLRETPANIGRVHSSVSIVDDVIWLLSGTGPERCLHRYDRKEDRIAKGEKCGEHVQRMVALKVAFPSDIM